MSSPANDRDDEELSQYSKQDESALPYDQDAASAEQPFWTAGGPSTTPWFNIAGEEVTQSSPQEQSRQPSGPVHFTTRNGHSYLVNLPSSASPEQEWRARAEALEEELEDIYDDERYREGFMTPSSHQEYSWNNWQLRRALKKAQRNLKDQKYEMGVLERAARDDTAEATAAVERRLKAAFELVDIEVWDNMRLFRRETKHQELLPRLCGECREIARQADVAFIDQDKGMHTKNIEQYQFLKRLYGKDAMRNHVRIGAPSLRAIAARSLTMNILGYSSDDTEYPTSSTMPSNLEWLKIPRGYDHANRTPFAELGTAELERPVSRSPSLVRQPTPSISFSSSSEEGRMQEGNTPPLSKSDKQRRYQETEDFEYYREQGGQF